ncbi:MAG: hypothetical protein ACYDD4_01850 [Acidimicrobiales bacterium]
MAMFTAWAVVGAALGLGFERRPIIGVLVVPFAVAVGITLATRAGGFAAAPGLLAGGGGVMVDIALRNNAGPGLVCQVLHSGGADCRVEVAPGPWWLAGGMAVMLAVAVFVLVTSRFVPRQRNQPGA